ncbi:DHA2 family efflux MFS transporter permease subunit [Luteipulveratus mongoliensis]|uniref:Major facilitator transporter n=1 Tax=Luteipulveratus mongoliensis TaxID=571913 RepID=A0A0K1JL60_9MICO|nr:DHA2 family efflux MFS transporter permease subunit [Luteipulveratus mongoliensis]AKU17451.1 major facilitator transporter [Luteipulveratus mongoliensis]
MGTATVDRPADAGSPPASARRRVPIWLVLLATSLPMFMATLDNLVMTSALPVISTDLHPSIGQLQWFMNAYTLAFATLMLPAATLGDRLGRRRMFLGGIAVFTLASIASALSTSPETLIAARAVQGAGAAAILPLSLTLLAGAVPVAKRPLAIGIWGGVTGLGVALGPVVGGAVVEGISWQSIFWINVPVGMLAVPLVLWVLDESFGRRSRLDVLGVLLGGAGIFAGVWAIVHGNDDGWTSASVLGTLAVSAAALGAFVVRERRVSYAAMPTRLFRSRSFAMANVIALAFSIGMFGAVFLLSQYLQIVLGYSPLEAGIRTLPWTAAPMVVAPIAGMLAPRVGVRPLLTIGLILQAAALGYLALVITPGAGYTEQIPGLILAGVGMGLTFAPSATAVLSDMAEADHATASSVNATVREIGVSLGVAVLTAVFLAADGHLTPTGYADALRPALLVGMVSVALGIIPALLLPGKKAAAESSYAQVTAAPAEATAAEVPVAAAQV